MEPGRNTKTVEEQDKDGSTVRASGVKQRLLVTKLRIFRHVAIYKIHFGLSKVTTAQHPALFAAAVYF